MRASAYEKLMEAMKLLASAGLPLLSEEVEELALQVDLQTRLISTIADRVQCGEHDNLVRN